MQQKLFKINNIPAKEWGENARKAIIAVHGNMSHKSDIPIQIIADNAVIKGYQVLSFDLPNSGDRKSEGKPCLIQYCIEDLVSVISYAKSRWEHISLFANSMGAFFSLLSYQNETIEKAWLLSPVVDMMRIIENMMSAFSISEERLRKEKIIPLPTGQTLYWDYYYFVKNNKVLNWKTPTFILYGKEDDLCEKNTIDTFVHRFSCKLDIAENSGHYFHTEEQLKLINQWINKNL